MYANGEGVIQDHKEAVKLFRLSAEQSDARAQRSLGFMFERGLGVHLNRVYAYMWYDIASANGLNLAAKSRDIISKQMTPSQIEKAQELTRQCIEKEYKDC